MELKSVEACGGNQSIFLLTFVLLGRRNSGKTSAANAILGRTAFKTGVKTKESLKRHGWSDGVRVVVVDTPGWSAFGLANAKQVKQEVLRSEMLSCAGHRVFLLVIPVDAFSSRDREAVEENLGILGYDVWKHTMVLFTWADELRGKDIEEHIKKCGEPLQRVLEMCGYRYHVFNNKATDHHCQVSQLIQTVERMWQSDKMDTSQHLRRFYS